MQSNRSKLWMLATAVSVCLLLAEGARSSGFEDLSVGPLTTRSDATGTWEAATGHATIHSEHARTGKQCLRILGGVEHQVVWCPAKTSAVAGRLEFYFERWTRRTPFDFRVEAFSEGKWTSLHHDSGQAVVGPFKNDVAIELPSGVPQRIRFTATTPKGSGVMIDDLRLVPATPMRVLSIEAKHLVLPALVGNSVNPLLDVRIDVEGSQQPLRLRTVDLQFKLPTVLDDVDSVELLAAKDAAALPWRNMDSLRENSEAFGSPLSPAENLRFEGNMVLEPGVNRFIVSARLKPTAEVQNRILIECLSVQLDDDTVPVKLADPPTANRIGDALRKAGDDGAHTYRIPGLVTTPTGTLIAVYDIRRRSGGDLPGDIDIGMSRSVDGGRSWEPMRVIMDTGSDPQWNCDGIGDPAVLVDEQTGVIWVAATWSHGNRSWRGSGPGLTPEETGQLMLVRSDDDGRTWSQPINITRQVKRPEWCFLLQGPGRGITMRDGTLVFAAQYQDTPAAGRLPRSTILYSQDHGKTWVVGTGAFDDTTEAQVVELEPGTLMLNCRYNRDATRVVMTTTDMGKTWQEHPTSRRSLIEPRACMASLLRADIELDGEIHPWLFFSNPDSTSARERISIKASSDNGMTWPKANRLLLDQGRGAGYSCLTMVDRDTLGILYEGSMAHLVFQRIPVKEIISNKPTHESNAATKPELDQLRLAPVFSDHMVLQANQELPIWGWAPPNQTVTVTLDGDSRTAQSDDAGQWSVMFPPRSASPTPIRLHVASDSEEVCLVDLLMGEVWLCAGQSNMEWPLSDTDLGPQELARGDRPLLRLLKLDGGAKGSSGRYTLDEMARLTPSEFCQGAWQVSSADSARSFSAVGWYFGRYLREQLDVPVGLISPAIGGTPTESWIRRESLQSDPALCGLVQGNWLDNPRTGEFCRERGLYNLLPLIQAGEDLPGDSLGPNHSFKPGFMWQAGIQPLIPFAIRGAIWYQGESNAETPARATEHELLLSLLIRDWRERWGQGDFPFIFAQLPALNRPAWPQFRDGQRKILERCDKVGMAVTIDSGHPSNVHPRAKQVVGQRLAIWALGTTYGKKGFEVYSGPLLRDSQISGRSMILRFDHVGSGLASSDGLPLRHFEMSGPDGVFHPAEAVIDGLDIVLSFSSVTAPRQARYAWTPYPTPPVNFFNQEGLPASPFATKDFGE